MRPKDQNKLDGGFEIQDRRFFVVRKERCIMFILLMYWGDFSKKAL